MAHKKVKNIKLSVEELKLLSNEELIERFIQIQEHNVQLKNIITKLQVESVKTSTEEKNKDFDFSKYDTINVFIKFLYLGWNYQGYATVEDTLQTVEHKMMEALKKCHLIESRETAEYHRCGRTDKGVSAFSQVISLKVRKGKDETDLDYCGMLNRILPSDIRVTGWCKIEPGISARFNCTSRVYRYYFPQGNLDISAMKEAAQFLKGTHDFRNLCKMDVANGVTNFIREIVDADVLKLHSPEDSGYELYELRVVGSGFLWHQIRCIMAVLLMVGQNLEKPNIITKLLDIQLCPKKPQYNMASETGLCLFDTTFDCPTLWCMEQTQLSLIVTQLQGLWTGFAIKTAQIRAMLRELESQISTGILTHQADVLLGSKRPRQHQPLLTRNTCNSLEERVVHYRKKFKTDKEDGVMHSDTCSKSNATEKDSDESIS